MELLDYMENVSMLTYQKMQSCQFFYQDKIISQHHGLQVKLLEQRHLPTLVLIILDPCTCDKWKPSKNIGMHVYSQAYTFEQSL